MKIILINPLSADFSEVRKKCLPPQNLLYLAAQMKHNGFDARILDVNALGLPADAVIASMDIEKPDIVGIPVLTEILHGVHALAHRIKQAFPSVIIILGGPHVTAVRGDVLEEFPMADYALSGESENTLVSLCNALSKHENAAAIPGLIFRDRSGIVANEIGNIPRDLDALEIPDRDLLVRMRKKEQYYMLQMGWRRVDSILTSRGCPFQCGFCANIKGPYRARSPEHVIEELVRIKQRGVSVVDIVDTNFTLDKARAMRIFDLIIKEKLKLSFRFKTRVDYIDEKLVKKAYSAGCHLISFGMESGVQGILDAMNKKATVEANAYACEATKKAGMLCHAGFCIGYPGETPETIRQTIDFIIKVKPTTVGVTALMPYPGTPVFEYAKAKGMLRGAWSTRTSEKPWVKLAWMRSFADLDRYVQYAKNRIYFRPFYIYNFSKNILRNANVRLAGYIVQESLKSIRGLFKG